jgi:hypothetical protein
VSGQRDGARGHQDQQVPIDALLRSWATATERRPPPIDHPTAAQHPLLGSPLAITRAGPILAAVLVLGTFAVTTTMSFLSLERDRQRELAAARADLTDQQLGLGDPVVATGLLITHDAGTTITICVPTGYRPALLASECLARSEEGQTAGPARSVPVLGLRPDEVPGLTRGRAGFSTTVYGTVYGMWLGDAIGADAFVAAEPSGPTRYELACEEPAGGWQPATPEGAPGEEALYRLQAEVEQQRTLYSGLWRAYRGGITMPVSGSVMISGLTAVGPPGSVLTVGTVGDLARVQSRLARIYPYALCVTQARFSAAELSPVAVRLGSADLTWQAQVERDTDRVRVYLTYVDAAAIERIGDDADKVVLEPLVRKVRRAVLTEEQAISRALAEYSGAGAQVTWTRLGRAVDLDPALRPPSAYALVWAIGLSGSFGPICGGYSPPPPGTPAPCIEITRATVYLDALTGEFMQLSLMGP